MDERYSIGVALIMDKKRENTRNLFWAYDEVRRNKSTKSCYENERLRKKRKRKIKKGMVEYDSE